VHLTPGPGELHHCQRPRVGDHLLALALALALVYGLVLGHHLHGLQLPVVQERDPELGLLHNAGGHTHMYAHVRMTTTTFIRTLDTIHTCDAGGDEKPPQPPTYPHY
jgi:tRNA A37 threonylcarbamoyltransferase TsaD